MATAKIGCYSGNFNIICTQHSVLLVYVFIAILQVIFVAGSTKFAIRQHTELPRDGYDTTIFPC